MPTLVEGEILVLTVSLPVPSPLLMALERSLSRTEAERAAAFHFPADRERHVVARGVVRFVLGRHLGVVASEVAVRTNRHGKPVLVDGDVGFNVSHSEAVVMWVFAHRRRVGIDVEQIRDDIPYRDMAARTFSADELESLRAQPLERQVVHFFETWTRKEAYVKGRGRGMSVPPQSYSVRVGGDEPHPVDDQLCSARPGSWLVGGVAAPEGYTAALAVEGSAWSVRRLDGVDLLTALQHHAEA